MAASRDYKLVRSTGPPPRSAPPPSPMQLLTSTAIWQVTMVLAGDHLIVLCAVRGLEVTRAVTPLLFFQGGYGGFSLRGMTAKGDADLIAAIRLADPARRFIEPLAEKLECESGRALVGVNDGELTTAASAHAGDASMRERRGDRIPGSYRRSERRTSPDRHRSCQPVAVSRVLQRAEVIEKY